MSKVKKKKSKGTRSEGRPYKIVLKHNQPRVFTGRIPEEAWTKYKVAMGIISTDHQPKITRCGEDVQYDPVTGIIDDAKETKAIAPEDDHDDDDFDTEEEFDEE